MLGLDMDMLVNIWLGTESEVVEIKIAGALQGFFRQAAFSKDLAALSFNYLFSVI